MGHYRKRFLACVLVCMVFLGFALATTPYAKAAKPSPRLSAEEQSFVDHINQDYAMDLTSRLSSFSFEYDGEVVPGSYEDFYTASYIKAEMEALELDEVTMEPFKLVSWDYRSASVEITSPVTQNIRARSMANSPSTPNGGAVESELVFVGLGRTQDYENVPGGVEGKIVLIERSVVMWYTTPSVREAAYHGAAAALVYNPYRDPEALNVDTAHNDIPTLSITGNDAAYLKELLEEGPVQVKVDVDNVITENADAYAVCGFIYGSKYPDEYIIFEGHHDHWWCGSNDDNAAVASVLAIAKAIKDAGITPKRTLVFMTLSGHESGTGGSKESFWDWGLGSYYFMTSVHPEWAQKIVMSFCSDDVGIWADYMYVETTPELQGFLRKVAFDTQVQKLMYPVIYTPVSSFDSWGFYMAGVPACSIYCGALSAIVEEAYYHTDLATVERLISPEHLKMDAAFRGVGGLRLSQAEILPYELTETGKEVREAVDKLLGVVPDADMAGVLAALDEFDAAAKELQAHIKSIKKPTKEQVAALNAKMHLAINTVNPYLWDQDIGVENPYPGWCSVSKFETYAHDLPLLRLAIDALERGDPAAAEIALEGMTTMDWGEHVSYPVYLDIVWLFAGTPYLNWATGHLPWLTDVHQEHSSVEEKAQSNGGDLSWEISSLSEKLDTAFEKLGMTSLDVSDAFNEGAMVLSAP